jgi:diacylglycerol kinase (ATP)
VRYDIVVLVGGDGTAKEDLNELIIAWDYGLGEARLGVIPIERGNDFAYSIGTPDRWDLPVGW